MEDKTNVTTGTVEETPEQIDYRDRAVKAEAELQAIFKKYELVIKPVVELVYAKQGIGYKATISWIDNKKNEKQNT